MKLYDSFEEASDVVHVIFLHNKTGEIPPPVAYVVTCAGDSAYYIQRATYNVAARKYTNPIPLTETDIGKLIPKPRIFEKFKDAMELANQYNKEAISDRNKWASNPEIFVAVPFEEWYIVQRFQLDENGINEYHLLTESDSE